MDKISTGKGVTEHMKLEEKAILHFLDRFDETPFLVKIKEEENWGTKIFNHFQKGTGSEGNDDKYIAGIGRGLYAG